MKKEYTNGEVTVIWQPEKCSHSALCVKGLPAVFKPRQSPWITLEGTDSKTIIDQIKKCPSGALSFRMNNDSSI